MPVPVPVSQAIDEFLRSVTKIDDDTGYLDKLISSTGTVPSLRLSSTLVGSPTARSMQSAPTLLSTLSSCVTLRYADLHGHAFDDAGSCPRAAAQIIPLRCTVASASPSSRPRNHPALARSPPTPSEDRR